MHDTIAAAPSDPDEPMLPAWLGPARIGIGLLQGLLLFVLYTAAQDKVWPATAPMLFLPLVATGVLVPLLLVSALGHMPRRQVLVWTVAAAALIALPAVYDAWRRIGAPSWQGTTPSPLLSSCLAAGMFIAHALVLAATEERRRIASYATYFEAAWKLNLQIASSALFVGATWVALMLGAALFGLVKLDFLKETIEKAWFWIPVTTFAFASALHLTDVKPAIVHGIRNLLHVLLSMVLPVLTVLAGGFLASLPFTGLEPLWSTRSAASLLLGTAGAFVVLINAAYQDGASRPARPVALAARVASLLLVPLVLLAAWALALRVTDHGWSGDRVIAAACLLVAACYAGGYAAAALRRGWLRTLAGVNIAAAFVVLAVLLALLSPLADPVRVSVDSQMARLAAGHIKLSQLDVGYLYRHGARRGQEALARLEQTATGPEAGWLKVELARLRRPGQFDPGDAGLRVADNLQVWPAGAALPAGFVEFDWRQVKDRYSLPLCLRTRGTRCDAFVMDLGGDARPEVLLIGEVNHGSAVLRQVDGGGWQVAGSLPHTLIGCAPLLEAMRAGNMRVAPPPLADLEVGGQRIVIDTEPGWPSCPPTAAAQAAPAPPVKDAPR